MFGMVRDLRTGSFPLERRHEPLRFNPGQRLDPAAWLSCWE